MATFNKIISTLLSTKVIITCLILLIVSLTLFSCKNTNQHIVEGAQSNTAQQQAIQRPPQPAPPAPAPVKKQIVHGGFSRIQKVVTGDCSKCPAGCTESCVYSKRANISACYLYPKDSPKACK